MDNYIDHVAKKVSEFCSDLLSEYVVKSMNESTRDPLGWANIGSIAGEIDRCEAVLKKENPDDEELREMLGTTIIHCMEYVGDTAAKPVMWSRSGQYNALLNVQFVEELFREIANNPAIALETTRVTGDKTVDLANEITYDEYAMEGSPFHNVDLKRFLLDTKKDRGNIQKVQGCYFVARMLMCIYAERMCEKEAKA